MAHAPGLFLFVRHAIAVPAEDFEGADADRPLTPKGTRKARAIFRRAVKIYPPTRIVASPFVRAVETARLLAQELPGDAVAIETTEALLPDAGVEDWHAYLKSADHTRDDTVAVVGHEPSLSALFAAQLGLPGVLPFKKAGIGVVRPRRLGDGDLVAFVPPKVWLGK